MRRFSLLLLPLMLALGALEAHAAAAIRLVCDGSADGAEITVNGQFKGECPLDVQVEAGEVRIRAVKADGKLKERVFEQTVRLGDGVVKKVEIVLSAATFTPEGQKIEDERLRVEDERRRAEEERARIEAEAQRERERQRVEAERLAAEEAQRAEAARLAAAIESLVAAGRTPGTGARFRDCEICPVMTWVPRGSFRMGDDTEASSKPSRIVTFKQPFAVGVFELTFDEWDACVREGGCNGYMPEEGRTPRTLLPDRRWGRGRMPVINIALFDARRYVQWLSAKTGQAYRLLSEAEWEYACKAGHNTAYCGGPAAAAPNLGWFPSNSDEQTQLVGTRTPNAWGLHDMSGNVWEWVADCFHDNYSGAPSDGSAWTTACNRNGAARGGSWLSLKTATGRGWNDDPQSRNNNNMGMRVARSLKP